ncbi:hypothetical protein PPL_12227 [Heterostelium album PN500]|uniref:FAD-binding domain-containing protein n=1 Tax=Heterostelium pallidum (strain ATCC 26659 / Pp 5 / PN500) TaxID=670386 RepID=D3BM19_HETP5|nr:hypothetical protein PPL_12227 [Heterostelium album PN500]EFA77620.1 hypothetical protein PPL_12227 [Heterostelium album PN500]|eukprot:XP_020429748.1 hypothetical protein PPL_12227 [Heterostelium album PN500]
MTIVKEKDGELESTTTTSVLIVGGGIVGLTSALLLQRQGIDCILVEKHQSTNVHPRSRGFNARTMEIWHELGVDKEIAEAGSAIGLSKGIYSGRTLLEVMSSHTLKLRSFGFGLILIVMFFLLFKLLPGIYFSLIMGAIAFSLMKLVRHVIRYYKQGSPFGLQRCTQDLAEPILLQHALTRAKQSDSSELKIHFNTECVDFIQDSNGVTATLKSRDVNGKTFEIKSKYMLACDGANSPTRTALKIEMDGVGVLSQQLNIFFRCDLSKLVVGREFSMVLVENEKVRGLFASINNSDLWVLHVAMAEGETIADYPRERCIQCIKYAIGDFDVTVAKKFNLNLDQIELKGSQPWWSRVRVAKQLVVDRIILVGDSAKNMPPWGGFGANSGIAEAHNLAWKLAAILRGEAEPSLLATYQDERHPIAAKLASLAGSFNDSRGLIQNGITTVPTMILKVFPYLILGYGYRSKSFNNQQNGFDQVDEQTRDLVGRPGTRVPHKLIRKLSNQNNEEQVENDGEEQREETKIISTLDLIDYRKSLLIVGGESRWQFVADELLRDRSSTPLKVVVAQKDFDDSGIDWSIDFGITTSGMLLVRPDGFVSSRFKDDSEASKLNLIQSLNIIYCKEN